MGFIVRAFALAPAALALAAAPAGAAQCRVSFYDQGSVTASGARFDPWGATFAHRSWAFGTRARFCFRRRCAIAVATDRGPFVAGRCADVSRGIARAFGLEAVGVAAVDVERLDPRR